MLNNKGQSLVLFILMMPILLGIMALVIDVGNAICQKNEIDNVILFVLDYGLNLQLEKEENFTNKNTELDEISTLQDQETVVKEENDNDEHKFQLMDIELEQLQKLLEYNLETGEHEISLDDNMIKIISKNEISGFFSNMFGFQKIQIESKYYGYLDGDKKIIQKIQ